MSRAKKIMIIVLLLVIAVTGAVGFLWTREIDSRNIVVEGNAYYSNEEIINYILKDKYDKNPYILYYKTKYKDQRAIPFVDKYEVKITSMNSVKITVYEKKIIGYVTYMGSNMYFDKDGTVVESSVDVVEGIPKVTGLQFGSIVLYESLPVGDDDVFEFILNVTQTLQKYSIPVDKIYISDNKEVSIYMGNVKVELGRNEYIIEKMSSLNDILTTTDFDVNANSGTLNMKEYNENGEYTFEKSK